MSTGMVNNTRKEKHSFRPQIFKNPDFVEAIDFMTK